MKKNVKRKEFEIVEEFSEKIGLKNKTDGTLFIYSGNKGQAKKPDGYYYYEGITFILDAKAEGEKFIGQLEDYMKLEQNKNFVGFKYNGKIFECYIRGKIEKSEKSIKSKDYYKNKYFKTKISNENIVDESAKKLAKQFRNSKINKQMNVPFIGAVFLHIMFEKNEIEPSSTQVVLNDLKKTINKYMKCEKHKEFRNVLLKTLDDATLKKAKIEKLRLILKEIYTIYTFINISVSDYKGHDIMNNFLRVFRKWNSVDAKEKGQVFTPDHIAQLMYRIAKCSKDNVIMDPCCGSGTFLTNAMANMFKEAKGDDEESQKIKTERLIGIEADDFNATLASINMMLHGDGSTNIDCGDCFEALYNYQEMYDRVLMNPPFSTDTPELKYVYEALVNMKDDGILSTILPKSCLKGIGKNNRNVENVEWIRKITEISKILSIVSLPNELFLPNAGVATCILTIQKRNRKHDGKVFLVDCSNDSFTYSNKVRSYNPEWEKISKEVISACNGKIKNEKRVCSFDVDIKKEMLFEAYRSNRNDDIEKETFEKYLREYASGRILCGMEYKKQKIDIDKLKSTKYDTVSISNILYKIKKGQEKKSIDRKIENKYLKGVPIIIAKKDNNGIGGLIENPKEKFNDKICIITGGDGGGGKTYYCDFDFCATNFVLICDFVEENIIDKFAKFYISVVISEKLYKTVSHGRNISDVPDIKIKLPILENGKLDYKYMSNFIKSLQFSDFLNQYNKNKK